MDTAAPAAQAACPVPPFDLAQARHRWLMVLGFCLLIGTANGLGAYFTGHGKITIAEALVLQLLHWMVWAALFPIFHGLVRRLPLDRGRRMRSILGYVVAGPPLFFLHGTLYLAMTTRLYAALWDEPDMYGSFPSFWGALMHLDIAYRVMGYSFLLASSWALEFSQRSQDNAERAARLETQLAKAQLDALKMQLHPHFLFNTLNSISALLHRDPDAADRMIARLGDFLRLTLRNGAGAEVPLVEEMHFVRCYLGIEELRFRDRLTTRIEVAPDVEKVLVPNLVLQPLVENAIRHGIDRVVGAGQIVIRAERVEGDRVRLEVSDNGPGLQGEPQSKDSGVGLANTAARLQALYGARHRFHARGVPGAGFTAVVEVPFRLAVG
jgi:signal transduction histidine kinase